MASDSKTLRIATSAIIAGSIVLTLVVFFPFVVEDAGIVARYAENLVRGHGLVYNHGERVQAFTSPLHVLVEAVLFAITGDTLFWNKVLGFPLTLASGYILYRETAGPAARTLSLALFALSPGVILWAIGGLETPILLFLITILVRQVFKQRYETTASAAFLGLLAALAFLTRFDSAVFTAPILLGVMVRSRNLPRSLVVILTAGLLPLLWILFAHLYYGNVFPTSYYVKPPTFAYHNKVMQALKYSVPLILLMGLPFTILHAIARGEKTRQVGPTAQWPLALAVLGVLLYGLGTATAHMMFTYRIYVPYTCAALLLLASASRANATVSGRRGLAYGLLLATVICYQGYHLFATYTASLNSMSRFGEYPNMSVKAYTADFQRILTEHAIRIRAHWSRQHEQSGIPRIATFGAGIMPHLYAESYIFEELVSFRKKCKPDLHAAAHYIQAMRQRTDTTAFPATQLITRDTMTYDGVPINIDIYYNPTPKDNPLPSTIDGPCKADLIASPAL